MDALIYRPTHQQQKLRLNGVLIGCTDTSTAMYADAVTMGGVKITEAIVRQMSNERLPDPASPGLNIPQCIAVMKQFHIAMTDRTSYGPETFQSLVSDNRKQLAQLWYSAIGGTPIGHAVLVQYRELRHGQWFDLINDPMRTAAVWMEEDRVLAGMKEFAMRSGLASGLRFATSRKVQKMAA